MFVKSGALIVGGFIFTCSFAQPHKCFRVHRTPNGESFVFYLLGSAGSQHKQVYGALAKDCQCDRKKDHYQQFAISTVADVAGQNTFIVPLERLTQLIKNQISTGKDIALQEDKKDGVFLNRQAAVFLEAALKLKKGH